MTAPIDASTTPMPDDLHAALQRLAASIGRLNAAAGRQEARPELVFAPAPAPAMVDDARASRFAAAQAEALGRLERAEQLVRAVAGRLAAPDVPAMDQAS